MKREHNKGVANFVVFCRTVNIYGNLDKLLATSDKLIAEMDKLLLVADKLNDLGLKPTPI
ncbi:hypothetical protein NLX69_13600 [Rossellomorea sp. BNER]|nr:hypothetical protein [Rossellomorea sp. BNER]